MDARTYAAYQRIPGTTQPDTAPVFSGTVADQTYAVGTEVALTLPEATGGEGALTYTLRPRVPGLTFDADGRTLAGTPTNEGTYAMTYGVVDGDGDAATLRFVIVVSPADTQPSFGGQTVPDQSYMVGETIVPLVLPAASGGDGRLTYTLRPSVPGLNFDPDTRRLTGAPSHADSHAMTYTVTDEDSDTDVLTFPATVEPETVPDGSPGYTTESLDFGPVDVHLSGDAGTLEVCVRDWGCEDGDIVTVLIGDPGRTLMDNVTILRRWQCEDVPIRAGYHYLIRVNAINSTGRMCGIETTEGCGLFCVPGGSGFAEVNSGELRVAAESSSATDRWDAPGGSYNVGWVNVLSAE